MFVGILSNDGSATTQKIFTALGHAPLFLNNDIDSRDPWSLTLVLTVSEN